MTGPSRPGFAGRRLETARAAAAAAAAAAALAPCHCGTGKHVPVACLRLSLRRGGQPEPGCGRGQGWPSECGPLIGPVSPWHGHGLESDDHDEQGPLAVRPGCHGATVTVPRIDSEFKKDSDPGPCLALSVGLRSPSCSSDHAETNVADRGRD